MRVEERQRLVLQRIHSNGSVSVGELVAELGVSEMTIRRDLRDLEHESQLRRVRGGAVSARGRAYEPPFLLRADGQGDAKTRIGRRAAELIQDGASVALDVGTTTLEIARHLLNRQNLTVITPSLRLASLLSEQPNIRLILAGGIVRQGELSLIGELAERAFTGFFVDQLFLAVGGVSAEAGLTEYNLEDAQVKRAMLRSAKEVILTADATKFGRTAFAAVAPLAALHRLITDAAPPPPLAHMLADLSVEVLIAQ